MDAVSLGPFALPWARVQVALALLGMVLLAELYARRVDRRLATWAWNAVLVGFLVARVAFVIRHAPVYAQDPLSVLWVWQGGFDAWVGVVAGGVYTLMALPRNLWKYALLAAVAAGLIYGLLGVQRRTGGKEVRLPPLTLERLGGGAVELGAFQGKPLVVNAWATWCPPCRRELPMLLRVAERTPEVRFAFVSQGEDPETVRRFLEKEGLVMEWALLDPMGRFSEALKIQGLPTTFFFDREGRLVLRHMGELSEALLLDYLRALR
ncbi:MAG: prolipoprotein diacylglyceryl transferase family protein [Thermaceae bacterium]